MCLPTVTCFRGCPVGWQGTKRAWQAWGSKGKGFTHLHVSWPLQWDRGGREKGIGGGPDAGPTVSAAGQALSQLGSRREGMGGGVKAAEPRVGRLGWGLQEAVLILPAHPWSPDTESSWGLSVVHERLRPGVLEGHGAEGLLPWLLGVPVLRYGGPSPAPHAPHPPACPFIWLI